MSTSVAPATCAAPGLGQHHDQVQGAAIEKALILYDALRGACPAMRLSDLSRSTGLPKSTTHRLLSALTRAGLVVRYGVGYAAADRPGDSTANRHPIGAHPISGAHPVSAARSHQELLRRLAPFLGDLMVRTRLTSSLALLDGADVVFAYRVFGYDNVHTSSDDSGRAPAQRTAAGRMLLSHDLRTACEWAESWALAPDEAVSVQRDLIQIRRRQFAVETAAGITCLAVPLPIGPDRPQIALTVKGKAGSIDQERTLYWLRKIADAAARSLAPTAARSVAPTAARPSTARISASIDIPVTPERALAETY